MVLHFLNNFKVKLNSLDSPSNSHETYKTMLQELYNLETILQVHAQKTGMFSLFLPEINDLTLKLSTLKRLYPAPKKKLSFFSLQLSKLATKGKIIDKVVSKPLEADFLKQNLNETLAFPIVNEEELNFPMQMQSKKKQKLESLVQDRLAANISSAIKPQTKDLNFKPAPFKDVCNKDLFNTKETSSLYNKDPYNNKETYNNNNNNNNNNTYNNKELYNKDPYNNNKDPYNNSKEIYHKDQGFKDPYLKDQQTSLNNYFQQQNRATNKQTTTKQSKEIPETSSCFITAKDQLRMNHPNQIYKQPQYEPPQEQDDSSKPQATTINKRFQPPYKAPTNKPQSTLSNSVLSKSKLSDDKLKNIDPKMIELIESEILDNSPKLSWSDISGLEAPKAKIIEMIVWPFSNPEIFTGIRAPPRGLLLFGPPGTGKTMIGKAIASDTNFIFFSISASSLTSKWVGEGEKMVKTLFAIAAAYQPAVVFIDEVDSLLCSRSDNENEASRRIKTEFLCQMEGTNTNTNARLLLIGATNRPQELDDAALRRFVKKLYIPLPNKTGRTAFLKSIMMKEMELGNKYEINEEEIEYIVQKTKGYSGADLRNLCAEAALNPLRGAIDIARLTKESLRATNSNDFKEALEQVKPTVSQKDLKQYLEWNRSYGTVQFSENDLDS